LGFLQNHFGENLMAIVQMTHRSSSLNGKNEIVVECDIELENRAGHILTDYGYLYLTGGELAEMYETLDDNGRQEFLQIFATILSDWERLMQLGMFT